MAAPTQALSEHVPNRPGAAFEHAGERHLGLAAAEDRRATRAPEISQGHWSARAIR